MAIGNSTDGHVTYSVDGRATTTLNSNHYEDVTVASGMRIDFSALTSSRTTHITTTGTDDFIYVFDGTQQLTPKILTKA